MCGDKRKVILCGLMVVVPIIGYCGYALLSARRNYLIKQGRAEVVVVQAAMSVLGIPRHWQEEYLTTHYKDIMEVDKAEENAIKRSTPKYASVRPVEYGGTKWREICW